MSKRYWWIFLMMTGAGLLIWFTQSKMGVNEVPEKPKRTATLPARQTQDLPDSDPGTAEIPRSQRHAAGEIEKHRQLQSSNREMVKKRIKNQISELLKYDGEQLMVYAAGLDLPDNVIKEIYPQYLEANRELAALKLGGLGNVHPTVKTKVEQIDAMKRQLDEGVVKLRGALIAQMELMASDPNNR